MDWYSLITPDRVFRLIRASAALSVLVFVAPWIQRGIGHLLKRHVSAQALVMLQRLSRYAMIVLGLIGALRELGFDLSVFLGAAGILGAAFTFSARDSLSQLICGIFLILEKSFVIGDTIQVDAFVGEVLSIDFLSVKLKTANHSYIRIPNGKILGSAFQNLSRLPQRCCEIPLRVLWAEDIGKIRALLLELVEKHPLCLSSPESTVTIEAYHYEDGSVALLLSVWVDKNNDGQVRSDLMQQIYDLFLNEKIAMPVGNVSYMPLGVSSEVSPSFGSLQNENFYNVSDKKVVIEKKQQRPRSSTF